MHPMLNIAIRSARKAGNIAIKAYENPTSIKIDKKSENDFVTNVDRAVETVIVESIRKSYPEHTIIGEECGVLKGADNDHQWVIDPIDGTTNFMKGIPHFAISIAYRYKGKTEIGVVFNPITNELYSAERGKGAQLNGYRLRVNGNLKDLNGALVSIAYPFKQRQYIESYNQVVNKLFDKCLDIRRTGSAALDLCYVSAGRIDLYFEIGLKPWDIAAGELILRESGGIITDFGGSNDYFTSGNVVAGTPKTVKDFISMTLNDWPQQLK